MYRRVHNLLQVLSCTHLRAWSLYWTTQYQPLADRQMEIKAKKGAIIRNTVSLKMSKTFLVKFDFLTQEMQ